jgi:hypothetical protein
LTGTALRDAVAEHVFKWQWWRAEGWADGQTYVRRFLVPPEQLGVVMKWPGAAPADGKEQVGQRFTMPAWHEDASAAFDVVNYLIGKGHSIDITGARQTLQKRWMIQFNIDWRDYKPIQDIMRSMMNTNRCEGDSFAETVCRSALKQLAALAEAKRPRYHTPAVMEGE